MPSSDTTFGEHTFVVGDRAVSLADTLVDGDGSTPRDLSGCDVALLLRVAGDNEDDPPGNVLVDEEAATIDDSDDGKVSYAWSAADVTAIIAAIASSQQIVCWGWWIRTVTATGKREVFPAKGRMRVIFNADPTT